MTTRSGQQTTFNEVGKVSEVVTGTATQTNVYHADGSLLLRVSSVEGASLTVGDTVLSQAVGSAVVAGFRTYSGAEGKPVGQRSAKTGTTGTTMTWLFTNLEGSVDTQTVANTGVTERNYRDPYGAPITMAGGAWADGSGYMNKPATASTGLTTVGARTYDPVLGKFLSVDPVIDANLPQQNTGYTYSGNNPVTFSDPSGLMFEIDAMTNGGGRKWPAFTPAQKQAWVRPPNAPPVRYLARENPVQHPMSTQPKKQMAKTVKKQANPYPWGPLITPNESANTPKPSASVAGTVCLVLCFSREFGLDNSSSITFGIGPRFEASASTSVGVASGEGWYVVGECVTAAAVGGTVEVGVGAADQVEGDRGIELNGLAGVGVSTGVGVGCSVGLRYIFAGKD